MTKLCLSGHSSRKDGRLTALMLVVALSSAWSLALAAPAPVPAPNRSTAPGSQPPITISPQIIVPQGPAPQVTVNNVSERDFWETWVPVGVAVLAAGVAVVSAMIAVKNFKFSVTKDCSAVVREYRAKQAEAGLLAYENNVARQVGAVLDLVERMVNDVSKIRPVGTAEYGVKVAEMGRSVEADQANGVRLCGEADDALSGDPPRPAFASLFVGGGLTLCSSRQLRKPWRGLRASGSSCF